MKRTLSVILCIITCFLIFTLCTPVTLAASYNGTCSSGITWSLDTADGVLTISGSGDMSDYSISSTPEWDRYQNYVKSVVFDGVTSVGAYTFYNGGNGYKYKKLTSVDFGSIKTIGKYAFRGCAFIDTITGANYVTVIDEYAFLGCSSVTSFPFSAIITINNGAFSYCTGLTSISLPSTLKKIGSVAFENCSSVSSITLPALITSIGDRAFADCTALTEVIFNSRTLSSVGSSVFGGSGSNAVLTIANNVGTIPAKMFSYFTGLTTVQGGTGIVNINDEAFAHTDITSFSFGAGVSSVSETAFADTMSLEAFTVNENNENFSSNSEGILLNDTGKQIIRYPGGKTDISYTIPSTVNSIAAGAFRESRYLRTFTAGSSITSISGYCFTNSPSLTTVSLASSVKTINTYAFANCKSLSNISMSGVSTIQNYAFAQCKALTGGLTTSTNLRTLGDFAFYDCDGLTSVTISAGPTTIGKYVFYNCDGIHNVSIASTVKTISEGAFSFCSALSSVSLSEGLTTVGNYAFVDCPALLSVKVPSTVTSIGKYAFGYTDCKGTSASLISGFKLYGYSGTTAQSYASGGGISFVISTDSDSETVIPISDGTDTADDGGIASWLEKAAQIPFINWLIGIFSKVYSFFIKLIRG